MLRGVKGGQLFHGARTFNISPTAPIRPRPSKSEHLDDQPSDVLQVVPITETPDPNDEMPQ